SYDPDGSIASYQWNCGDGATGSGSTFTHVYQTPGSYTATLTVTDNRGATSSTSALVAVQSDPTKVLHVSSLVVTATSASGWTTGAGAVNVGDASGAAVQGVAVTGSWSGAVTGSASGVTDASGRVSFVSKRYKKNNTVAFTVSALSKSGYTYD